MNGAWVGALLQHIRRLAPVHGATPSSDRELLHCFAQQRDEGAFATLVHRHGPMVLHVCRRTLGNWHDAEDACQATFMVLAAKAASRRWHESVANWLHEVAYRVALKARAEATRRSACEHPAIGRTADNPLDE